jgi:hypothetical protein
MCRVVKSWIRALRKARLASNFLVGATAPSLTPPYAAMATNYTCKACSRALSRQPLSLLQVRPQLRTSDMR